MLALIVACILAGIASLFSGCASTPGSVDVAVGLASDGAALVLQKNPKAVPALRLVSSGIDTVLSRGSLTPEQLKAFVEVIDKQAKLSPEDRFLIGRLIQRVHEALVVKYGAADIEATSPEVRATLIKIKKAIDDTLALHAVLQS